MKSAVLARDYRTYVALALAALIISYLAGGLTGLQGMSLGLVAAGFGVAALLMITNLVGSLARSGTASRTGTIVVVLAFLLKIPLFVIIGRVAQGIGAAAPACFVVGVILVYFSLVAWAAARP